MLINKNLNIRKSYKKKLLVKTLYRTPVQVKSRFKLKKPKELNMQRKVKVLFDDFMKKLHKKRDCFSILHWADDFDAQPDLSFYDKNKPEIVPYKGELICVFDYICGTLRDQKQNATDYKEVLLILDDLRVDYILKGLVYQKSFSANEPICEEHRITKRGFEYFLAKDSPWGFLKELESEPYKDYPNIEIVINDHKNILRMWNLNGFEKELMVNLRVFIQNFFMDIRAKFAEVGEFEKDESGRFKNSNLRNNNFSKWGKTVLNKIEEKDLDKIVSYTSIETITESGRTVGNKVLHGGWQQPPNEDEVSGRICMLPDAVKGLIKIWKNI